LITPIVHDLVAETEALASLKRFFEEWRRLTKPAEPATRLLAFLNEYRELQSSVPEPEPTNVPQHLDPVGLEQFCEGFRPIFAKMQREGEFVDIWSVAGLKRDELRHASVLAWFLDPNASHGFEQEIFHAWMSRLSFPGESRLQDPSLWRLPYRVATEVCPQDGNDRIDIEISGERFYLCVEVKIDAVEGKEQLRRYLDLARAKAGSRPFSIVYLSRDEPKKLSTDSEKVVSTTWARFATAIRPWQKQSSLSSRSLSRRLLDQFLNHVENLYENPKNVSQNRCPYREKLERY
jgi:hypothetical protein